MNSTLDGMDSPPALAKRRIAAFSTLTVLGMAVAGLSAPIAFAAAELGTTALGPTTLLAGLSGTYTITVSNHGDVGAPVEAFIIFAGKLEQTDQVTPFGGFECDVRHDTGINAAVRCTIQQLEPKTGYNIVVHGRGFTPGAGQLVTTVNSAAPGVQFGQRSQQMDVSIT